MSAQEKAIQAILHAATAHSFGFSLRKEVRAMIEPDVRAAFRELCLVAVDPQLVEAVREARARVGRVNRCAETETDRRQASVARGNGSIVGYAAEMCAHAERELADAVLAALETKP